ncbi:hotdog fold thioesterase [Streptococcus sp. zg-86]|uniref:Hotdog fold thioesterase n=1 Tax=Streptococcus zhangguiae TaxID=2664091 RepID=A0A6I4RH64_9STRE|nr:MULTISPECIES: PaaI family thioesterase [unclassified Streptococcus]MTB64743.1 hotdog fold thioesterase [Streptococcus sp. zg-86]MTB91315.1 hotdog fold thioesterase [Streptococcus sp. zg-36]MTB91461.1 hotdog fold thioesterase [Streptococcus sp. zg-36]MWV56754.1 hotdog fold thioesterase [Streptococcus sp. zg-70]QTH48486.1 PaaI family thioesterase [Streptococcus sp. zg-86]
MLAKSLHEIRVFENFEMVSSEKGHVVVTTEVVEKSLNYYGFAHGGYLFTLCDQISGLVAISTGVDAVTLQSSINYLKSGKLGDTLLIDGRCVHDGRTTKVVDVTVTNQKQEEIVKATFTMFVTGEHKNRLQ